MAVSFRLCQFAPHMLLDHPAILAVGSGSAIGCALRSCSMSMIELKATFEDGSQWEERRNGIKQATNWMDENSPCFVGYVLVRRQHYEAHGC